MGVTGVISLLDFTYKIYNPVQPFLNSDEMCSSFRNLKVQVGPKNNSGKVFTSPYGLWHQSMYMEKVCGLP